MELKFYEHPSLPEGAAMFICRKDDSRISDELRETITVPCVVARDLARLEQSLTLLHIAELWEEAAPYQRPLREDSSRPCPTLPNRVGRSPRSKHSVKGHRR